MQRGFFKTTLSKWGDVEIEVGLQRYRDGSPVMNIRSKRGPVATMSVCVPGAALEENEILIKGWSENEQIFKELVANKVLIPTEYTIPTGFCEAVACKLGEVAFEQYLDARK